MKAASKPISFGPSNAIARRLEKLGRISQLSAGEILADIAGLYLDQVFGDFPDTELLASHITGRPHTSKEKAEEIAEAYNAFSLQTARKLKRDWADLAIVVKSSGGTSRVQVQFKKPLDETPRGEVAA
jgi:hypothetical protein